MAKVIIQFGMISTSEYRVRDEVYANFASLLELLRDEGPLAALPACSRELLEIATPFGSVVWSEMEARFERIRAALEEQRPNTGLELSVRIHNRNADRVIRPSGVETEGEESAVHFCVESRPVLSLHARSCQLVVVVDRADSVRDRIRKWSAATDGVSVGGTIRGLSPAEGREHGVYVSELEDHPV